MQADLIKRLEESRTTTVTLGPCSFKVRRPTEFEAASIDFDKITPEKIASFITGWSGITEAMLFPGGSDSEIPFSDSLASIFLSDRMDIWEPILSGVFDLFKKYAEAKFQFPKN